MDSSIATITDLPKRSILEENLFAGKPYRFEIKICQNPTCDCKVVSLICIPENPELMGDLDSIRLEMNLANRSVDNIKDAPPEALLLAQEIKAQITDAEWKQLKELYFAGKVEATAQCDLDQFKLDLGPEFMGRDNLMVGFYQIFPFAAPGLFTLGADEWTFDDQYCVNLKCDCEEAILSFIRCSPTDHSTRPSISIRYNYSQNKITEVIPESDTDGIPGNVLLQALLSAQPDLNDFLIKRHAILRKIIKRSLPLQTVRLPVSKPGRNDPCPCGSGKKYKKCCGIAF